MFARRYLAHFPHAGKINKSVDNRRPRSQSHRSFLEMLAPTLSPVLGKGGEPSIVQFPAPLTGAVRSLRNMTAQLLQEAAQVIQNQQVLINVVSKRVRQLGLGHRPMVETSPRMSLMDIALTEVIAGKLAYEATESDAEQE